MRGVTVCRARTSAALVFLLTRLMRGVTAWDNDGGVLAIISTHTPHARRDIMRGENQSIHIPFLLTRLMRGVTAPC